MLGFFPWFLKMKNGLCLKKVLKVQKSKTDMFFILQAPGQVKSFWSARVNFTRPGPAWHRGGCQVIPRFENKTVLQQVATGVSS